MSYSLIRIRSKGYFFFLIFSLLWFAVASVVSVALADTINYPADNPPLRDPHDVVPSISTTPGSLFPDSPFGNTVTVNGGPAISGYAFGGLANADAVHDNNLTVSGGTVGWDAYGGLSDSGAAYNNSLTVSGGGAVNNAYGGFSQNGATYNNSMTVSGGGTVNVSAHGGYSYSGDAFNNSLTISGGTVKGTAYGGFSLDGDAYNNSVIISGGTVDSGAIQGGYVDGDGNTRNNSVTISGGTVNAFWIRGGYGGSGSATGNTVTIFGNPTLNTSLELSGGDGLGTDVFTGNTLNLRGWKGTVGDVKNFQYLNFVLPAGARNGDTQLTVTAAGMFTGTTTLGSTAKGLPSTVSVGFEGGGRIQQVGEDFTLIQGGTVTGTLSSLTAQGIKGTTLLYDFDLAQTGTTLVATVNNVQASPQTKALSEGRLAGHAFFNQGSDLIFGPDMDSILAPTRDMNQGGFVPFAVGSGGWSRYDTGSHADVSGFSMLTGLAWRQPVNESKAGSLLAGAFFEAGWGGYDSHNSFSNYASVKGDGDISYYGGGVLGRYDFAPAGPGNIYVDASFRAGYVSTDFSSSDLRDVSGRKADYDSGSAYYGAHAGLGYVWNITEKANLDMSTRYIWTHQDSDSVKLVDDPVRFKAIDSQRWRSGARFSYAVSEYVAPYAGAYYDHEFDGKAEATAYGYSIEAPDLTGGTGVGELGLTLKPVKDSGFLMELGVQGYTGVREGMAGSLQLKLEF